MTYPSAVNGRSLPAEHLIEERTRELRKSEQRFRMLFEKNGDAVLLLRTDEPMFVDANPAALEMLRCSKDELLGLHPEKLSPPLQPDGAASHEKAGRMIAQAILNGSHRFEWTHCSPHRADFPVEVLLTPIEEGSAPLMMVTWRDLTERKNSEMQYKIILNTTMDGFWVNDTEGNFLEVNDTYVGMIGYSHDELLAMNISDIEAVEQPDETGSRTRKILETGHDRFETRHRRKDGRILDIEVSVNNLPGAGGRMAVFLRDISRQKQAEADLIEAKRAAETANRAKSEFLANMSHEIRTPMNAIMGMTRLVLETELTPRQRDFLDKAHASSKALLTILNDILDYSKIEAGRLEISTMPFSVEETLRQVADLFSPQIAEKGLELFLEILSGAPDSVSGDQVRLIQVLNNLVGNAVKFTDHGEIHLRVEPVRQDADGIVVRFAVRDTGIGLSGGQAERLFQPFTQADGTITRQFGGTGLGLAISRRLVELMGGTITVSSSEGVGSVFSFTIRFGTAPAVGRTMDLQRLRSMSVLVVDDRETSRTVLTGMLQGWGLATGTAASGREALEMLRKADAAGRPFDVVLLDWRMPGMDGLQVAAEVERSCGGSPMKLIMAAPEDREPVLARATGLRLDGVLSKPVIPSHLFDLLLISRGSPPRPSAGRVEGQIPLDLAGIAVLLVEDNRIGREVAEAFLKSHGAGVTLVTNGAEAVASVRNGRFDLVLMDLHMPVMDGLEATRRIRRLPGCAGLPVIAMTAAVMQEDRENCAAAGMSGFVAKPIDPDELVAVIGRCLSGAGTAPPAAPHRDGVDSASSLPEVPGFDFHAALRRLSGNGPLLRKLLLEFFASHAETGKQVAVLLQEGAIERAIHLLHTLKGTAGTLGAVRLQGAAADLERTLARGEVPPSLAPFHAALDDTLQVIRSYFFMAPPPCSGNGGTPS